MPIEFNCDQCHTRLRTADQTGGKRVRCPTCSHVQAIPTTSMGEDGDTMAISNLSQDFAADVPQGREGVGSSAQIPSYGEPGQPFNPFAVHPSTTSSPFRTGSSKSASREKLIIPAILMIAFAVVGLMGAGLAIAGNIINALEIGDLDSEDYFILAWLSVYCICCLVSIGGAIAMIRLKGYALAMTGCIASVCSLIGCCLPQVGFGIWGIIVLLDENVKRNFG